MTGRLVAGLFAALVGAGALVGGLVGAWREHSLAHAPGGISEEVSS